MNSNVCIVVVGYNRKDSILRCLEQLNCGEYSQNVDLYVSIDDSDVNKDVYKVATDFCWKYGKKEVIGHSNRLGLKNHVLSCGEIVNKGDYDGIIMLEDDIYVAPDFHNYVCQAIKEYDRCSSIAGISLYLHNWNIDAKLPFYPIYEGYDTFFMQYAQSWGQAWSKRMWNEFVTWFKDNQEWDLGDVSIPDNVSKWSERSWLKYFIKYCAQKEKFFIYPYQSLSTNFSEAGEHNMYKSVSMQRALSCVRGHEYRFPDLKYSLAKYDCFFENIPLRTVLGYDDVTIDLYGRKKTHERYLLTAKTLNYKIVKSYGLDLKPIELNILQMISGKEIYLYDTQVKADSKARCETLLNYYWYDFDLKNAWKYLTKRILSRIMQLFK